MLDKKFGASGNLSLIHIFKSADGNGDSVQRYFFDYPQPVAGEGHFISTYKHNGNPIPSLSLIHI